MSPQEPRRRPLGSEPLSSVVLGRRWSYRALVRRYGEAAALALLPYQRGFGGFVHETDAQPTVDNRDGGWSAGGWQQRDEPRNTPWVEVHDEVPAPPSDALADLDSFLPYETIPSWRFRARAFSRAAHFGNLHDSY